MEPPTTSQESSLHFVQLEAAASIGVCRTFVSQPFKEKSFAANLLQVKHNFSRKKVPTGDRIPKNEKEKQQQQNKQIKLKRNT